MKVEHLYEKLKVAQEKRGFYFNVDKQRVLELLDSLLTNKDRYGYMSCPCRLASGNLNNDKDIVCPCIYRHPDIEEYGSCYCNLYVSKEWNEGKLPKVYVVDRRPPDLLVY